MLQVLFSFRLEARCRGYYKWCSALDWKRVAEGVSEGAWEPKHAVGGHYGAVVDMCWGVDGSCLLTASMDQTCRITTPCQGQWCELARPQVLPSPALPCHVMLTGAALLCLALSCDAHWGCSALPCPVMCCSLGLLCSALPCHVILTGAALLCPALPCPFF